MKFPRPIASLFRSSVRGGHCQRPSIRLRCEPLEDRSLLSYTVTDLGPGYAFGLNNDGQVVGVSNSQAVLWQGGTLTNLGAGASSRARAINDAGQVVGRWRVGTANHGFAWDSTTGIRDLGPLPGQAHSEALAVNAPGQIAGQSRSSTGNPPRAVLWDSFGGIQDLGTFGELASTAVATNGAGQVVGWAESGYGQSTGESQFYQYLTASNAFLWDPIGGATMLGTLGGTVAGKAEDLNDLGQVVGSTGDIVVYPHSWNYRPQEAFLWENGVMTDLDELSNAVAINNVGQVVGYSGSGAVLWDNGVISDLDILTGQTVYSVKGVNDVGQIVVNGQTNVYLLTPDTVAGLSVNDVTVTEGTTGIVLATFTVTRSGPLGGTTTVEYATANGIALAGSDYEVADGTITFVPGESSQTITVAVYGDTLNEANETFFVNLSDPTNAIIADGQGVGTIANDDSVPSLTINDVTMLEGNSGVTYFVFTVSLSAASGQAVTVNYATANGTAKVSNNDYIATSGTLTFALGETTKTITVQVKGDKKRESNESFFLNLTGALNADILDGQGLGTILNDD